MRWGRVMAAALVVAGTAPGVAAAARTWHPTLVISPSGPHAGDPAAALGVRGEAVAAWASSARGATHVEARTRRGPRAAWVRVVLSGALRRAPAQPAAAIDPQGRAVVAWRIPGGPVRAAVRDRREAPWRVTTVAATAPAEAGRDFVGAAAAFDPAGGTTLIWAERLAGAWTVRGARRARAGAPWSAMPPLAVGQAATPLVATSPSIALAPSGAAVVAWTVPAGPDPLTHGRVQAAVRSADGTWTPPAILSAAGQVPSAAVADGAGALVAWEERTGAGPATTEVRLAAGTAAGGWGAPETVAPGQAPRAAINPRGDVALTWAEPFADPEATPILAVIRRAGGAWPAPTRLTGGRGMTAIEASAASVVLAATGRAFVAWLDPEGPGSATTTLATALPGGPWDLSPRPVGSDAYGTSLVAAASGDALALLPGEGDRSVVVRAVDYDAAVRPVVRAWATGLTRAGVTRWRVVVRNPGRVPARGVRLRVSVCCGARLLSSRPAGARGPAPWVAWRLGTIAPGRARVVCLSVRERPGGTGRLIGTLSAVAVAPAAVSAAARR